MRIIVVFTQHPNHIQPINIAVLQPSRQRLVETYRLLNNAPAGGRCDRAQQDVGELADNAGIIVIYRNRAFRHRHGNRELRVFRIQTQHFRKCR
nr:hypothetical protein [Serratia marcescens]